MKNQKEIDNIIVDSLFSSGGTLDEKDAQKILKDGRYIVVKQFNNKVIIDRVKKTIVLIEKYNNNNKTDITKKCFTTYKKEKNKSQMQQKLSTIYYSILKDNVDYYYITERKNNI